MSVTAYFVAGSKDVCDFDITYIRSGVSK